MTKGGHNERSCGFPTTNIICKGNLICSFHRKNMELPTFEECMA